MQEIKQSLVNCEKKIKKCQKKFENKNDWLKVVF